MVVTCIYKCSGCGEMFSESIDNSEEPIPSVFVCECGKSASLKKWKYTESENENYSGRTSIGWPLHSDAMGVHPSQAKQAYEESVKIGVPTSFDKLGRAIFESRSHRKKYCERMGYYDKNAGYSDPQPKNL